MYGLHILCGIPHKISYPYIERYDFYVQGWNFRKLWVKKFISVSAICVRQELSTLIQNDNSDYVDRWVYLYW